VTAKNIILLQSRQTYASLDIAALTFDDKELPLIVASPRLFISPSRTYQVHTRYI